MACALAVISQIVFIMKHNHHEEAAKHHETAAKHHKEAHKANQEGKDDVAATHAQAAHESAGHATKHADEAKKKQTEKNVAKN